MGNDFIAKTMAETTRAIERSIFASTFARKNGFLQHLDPRVKLAGVLCLLIITGLSATVEILAMLYLMTLLLAVASRVPLGFFMKRVWIFIPLFTAMIVLPSVFNVVTPGRPLFTVITFSSPHSFGPFNIPKTITVTVQGVMGASILVLRVATSVSLAVLLVLTTEWIRLLKAMSVLRVPEMVILVLAMTYRYIHLFLRMVEAMLLARKSRQIGDSSVKEAHGWIASRLGVLVGKSYSLSSEVHLAMLSRGWSGNPRLMEDFSFGRLDWLWAAFTMGIVILWITFR
ncbi:MAG: cobalt ECF transporter T component CbiQ [Deltaproteobacteria bacterium]|nr:cobalt ECF transporter T component CbiQ [Deltaproteobacteria bacterium]